MINSLYTQSVYSFNGSVLTVESILSTAKERGTYVALADHHLHASVPFLQGAKQAALKPLLGIEVMLEYASGVYKALIYARGNKGYEALLKCETIYSFKERLSSADISPYKEDLSLILLQPHASDLDIEHYTKVLSYVYLNTALELNTQRVLRLSDDASLERLMKAILNTPSEDSDPLEETFSGSDSSEDFLIAHVLDVPGKKAQLPTFKGPSDVTSLEYLKALAQKGLKRRLQMHPHPEKPYFARLDKELSVIASLQYEDYFLIVWDIIKEARNRTILVGPGRGSAPGSLVSYALGITHIDPLEHGLLFERFLNQARKSMPDIDLDFPDDERDQLLGYLKEKYGSDHVALIATFGTFLKRSALRDSARILKIESKRLEAIIEASQSYDSLHAMMQSDANVKDWMTREDTTRHWLNLAVKLEGLPKHIGTHAAGVMLSDRPLTEYTALSQGLNQMSQTQLEQKVLEAMDLLKIDLLGLRNLSLIRDILKRVNLDLKKPLDLYRLSLHDKKTFEAFNTQSMNGIFQLESPGMRRFVKRMKPRQFEDIVALLALYRPGPMESINDYLKRKSDPLSVPKIHPKIDPILAPTSGIIIYQEQIMKIATEFAGYTLEEADLLRRAVSKKDRATLEKERGQFVKRAQKNGMNPKLADDTYRFIVRFADYGFNRSHSVAYAMIAYWMMYLKAHYPAAFIGVLMQQALHQEKALNDYISDAKSHRLDVLGPNILESGVTFKPQLNALVFPLTAIKHIGKETFEKIIEIRTDSPFTSFLDFIDKTKLILNARQWTYLIYAGALDVFKINHQTMIENLDALKTFTQFTGESLNAFKMEMYDEYDARTLESHEKLALSINLRYHVYHPYQKVLSHPDIFTLDDAFDRKHSGTVLAFISRVNVITTKNNDPMAFLELRGQRLTLDGVMFPDAFKALLNPLEEAMVLVQGSFQNRNQKWQFVITKVKEIPAN